MKIWFDITNTPHVHFFAPIIEHLMKRNEIFVTARDFSETLPLLDSYGIEYYHIGGHHGKSLIRKGMGLVDRIGKMTLRLPSFDISFGIGGQNTTPVSAIRRKPAVVFSDNDTSYKWHSYKLGSYFVFPTHFNYKKLLFKYGVKREQVYLYDGFKEDIYLASYKPNPDFLNYLPFKDFITIRPENLKANYVPKDVVTIVPELFTVFSCENILYLPRYPEERLYAEGFNNIYIPNGILPGKDVCFYTKAMLTGAGTFAREAALLGTPAVSFFPGTELLTVDKIMQAKGWEFISRSPAEIMNYVNSASKVRSRLSHSKVVLAELLDIVDTILAQSQQ